MKHMKQTASIISTYSADTFGVCSALYELGGMVVIHDPSGCNSTYTTHDEPRWFHEDSLIFVSALTEQDAILGNDRKLVDDIVTAARELKPRFICLIPSQIAHMIATDCRALCRIIEKKTGIPSFTLPTNSMHYYGRGIFFALEKIADFVCQKAKQTGFAGRQQGNHKEKILPDEDNGTDGASKKNPAAAPPFPECVSLKINLLGATPLDFAMNGSVDSIKKWLERQGHTVKSCWAMGSSFDEILSSYDANCNLVLGYGGLGAARKMQQELGIPYKVGLPIGGKFFPVCGTASLPVSASPCSRAAQPTFAKERSKSFSANAARPKQPQKIFLIGETVFAESLAAALAEKIGFLPTVIVPMETEAEICTYDTLQLTDEAELVPVLKTADLVIADPLYRPICPPAAAFVPLPHTAFSGRLYLKEIPNLIEETVFASFAEKVLAKLQEKSV
ncbi:MAG: nitrogenase component 1 [Mitsuokella sp.]|uniref:nitrogenase component 1 n=1 Tax=Mitsuokella sp. TaxID=2049034 RepID=UPI003F01A48C